MSNEIDNAGGLTPTPTSGRWLTLRTWPWSATLLRGAVAAAAVSWLVVRVGSQSDGSGVGGAVFASVFFLRWVAGVVVALRQSNELSGHHSTLSKVAASLVPAEWVGFSRLVVTTLVAGVYLLIRKPAPRREVGLVLEDRRKGLYNGFFAMNVIGGIVMVPLSIVMLPGLLPDAALRMSVHSLEWLLNLAILGDRWLVDAGGHRLTPDRLILHAGHRSNADIALDSIIEVEVVPKKVRLATWSRTRGIDPLDTGVVSVLDDPNVAIRLKPDPLCQWRRLQVDRPMPKCLFLYVDDPKAVVDLIHSALARRRLERGLTC